MLAAVLDLRKSGKTVIIITHRPSVLGAADLLVVMQGGKIIRYGPRDEVLTALRPVPAQPVLSEA